MRDKIQSLLQKDNLSFDDLMYVVTHEIKADGSPENITMFNKWRQKILSVNKHQKHVLTFENIEIRNVNLETVDLRYCKFINCSFYTCNFNGATFSDSKFVDCYFCACQFERSDFHGVDLENTKLEFVKSEGELCFIETTIKNSIISFESASFVDFSYSSLDSVLISTPSSRHEHGVTFINAYGFNDDEAASAANLVYSVDFTGCAIRNSTIVNIVFNHFVCDHGSIFNTDIVNCYTRSTVRMKNTTISNVRISPIFFGVLYEYMSMLINYVDERHKITKDWIATVRAIHDNFRFIGNSGATSEYYLLYKNAERASNFDQLFFSNSSIRVRLKHLKLYIIQSFTKYLFNYGESPFVVFLWILFVILTSGTISFVWNLSDAVGWKNNVYLSAITFATVGYGDVAPCGPLGRFLFGSEGLVGVFLMSIFVVVLTRKLISSQ